MSLPKPKIEKFTIGGDFSLWKMKMRALLVHQGLELALEEEDPETAGKEKIALGIWNKVEALCMKKSLTHKLFLKKRLYTFFMKENVSIQEHIDVFNKIILDLEGVENIKICDEDKAFFLLSSLPKSYEGFVDTMLYGRTTLTLEDVKAFLCSKEIQRHSGDLEQNPGERLMAKVEKKKDKKKKKNKNQFKKEDESEKENMKRKKYFYCKKIGHYIRDCAEKKKDNKEKSGDAAVAFDESSDGGYQSAHLLVASNGKIEDGGRVLMGNHNACKIVGIRSVKIRMYDGMTRTLEHVRHVPGSKKNLISLGMLDSSDYVFKSDHGGLKVMKNSSIIMKGVKNNGLYVLEGSLVPVLSALHVSSDVDKAKMWHLRLGHMSAKSLQELSKRGLLCGDNVEELKFCENCIFGKAHRMKFERGFHKSKAVLDYAHSDLWGPAQVPSLSGGRYFVTFIYDFLRKVWLYILKTKDQAFEKFKIWRALVENQFEMKLKALRADNGLEFCNKEFDIVRSMESPDTRLSVLKFKTPEEVWTGVSAGYKHLRIFGCTSYVHVKQGKLDSSALKGVFVGYPEGPYTDGLMKEAVIRKDSRIEVESSSSSDRGGQDMGAIEDLQERSKYDSCVYSGSSSSSGAVYLLLYVDDMLLASKYRSEIKKLKDLLNAEFEMKDMGCAKRIIGMDIIRNRAAGTLFVSQERYILKAVGSLMYAMVCTRADIAYAVSLVSRFMSDPGKEHWDAVKWIMRYLRGTPYHGLMYGRSKQNDNSIVGYVDSDFAGDLDGRKSISGYLFMVNGRLISWKATLQSVVILSYTEAEFVTATEAVKEGKWLSGILNELWLK
ncbi:Integrase catalytic domain-containing protein [Citrus sinensis]|uniref:Integrase catalytic domain-containing protein n=1 Tax=Citrus sinensis TaxID=2711 RepID=A0ACB8I3I6_CITSI|nr:Integrase catalytic domain-containing protein [Citrus sinensis]